jgi:hypothetical protein
MSAVFFLKTITRGIVPYSNVNISGSQQTRIFLPKLVKFKKLASFKTLLFSHFASGKQPTFESTSGKKYS